MTDDVLVKRGPNGNVYHKQTDEGLPCCGVNFNTEPDEWEEWDIEMAEAWKSPCQNKECYAETAPQRESANDRVNTSESWPV